MKRRMRYVLIVIIGIIVNLLVVLGLFRLSILIILFLISDFSTIPEDVVPNSYYASTLRNNNILVYFPNRRERYDFRYVMGHTTVKSNWYIITDYHNSTRYPIKEVYGDGSVEYFKMDRYIKIDKAYSNISFWQTINKIPYTDRKVFRKMENHIARRMKYGEVLTNKDGRLATEWTTDKKGYTVPVKRDMEYYRIILD